MASDGIPERGSRSTRPIGPIVTIEPARARLLRPMDRLRSMEDRVLGTADDVLGVRPPPDALVQRFYDAVCAIAHPFSPIPGQEEAMQMLNTMESMSISRGMDDEQRTRFAEGMAARVEEARGNG